MISLESVSIKENELVDGALVTHSDYYRVCCDYLNLLSSRMKVEKEYLLFLDYHLYVINDFNLSVLSVVRRHFIQSQLTIRHAIESAIYACYSFKDNNKKNHFKILNDGTLEPIDFSKKANKWIQDNFPDNSVSLKKIRQLINKNHAHSNNILSEVNYHYFPNDNNFNIHFFDAYPNDFIDGVLMTIIVCISNVLNFYFEVNKRFNKITFSKEFEVEFSKLESIKSELQIIAGAKIYKMFNDKA